MNRAGMALVGLLLTAPPMPAAASATAGEIAVASEQLQVRFSVEHAVPISWVACATSCQDAGAQRIEFLGAARPGDLTRLWWSGTDAAAGFGSYRVTRDENASSHLVTFRSAPAGDGTMLVKLYELPKSGWVSRLTIRIDDGADTASASPGPVEQAPAGEARGDVDAALSRPELPGVLLATGPAFVPPSFAGMARVFGKVRSVIVDEGGQRAVAVTGDSALEEMAEPLSAGAWTGIRTRFWAFLVRADEAGTSVRQPPGTPAAVLVRPEPPADDGWSLTFYSGPVSQPALAGVADDLSGLLFAALWDWLRALSFALLYLLAGLQALLGNAGLSIIALAAAVRVLMLPLSGWAGRLQRRVNETQARLQPEIDAVRAEHTGEERHRRTLEIYRRHGVHPLFSLQSLVGILIQIPVFIAVFDMLGEDFSLAGRPFLWIGDLTLPDRLAALPFAVPLLGEHLNLLPLLMTAITLVGALVHHDPSLTPAMARQQRLRLYLMAAAFFVLFYPFPAGMVLYWTSSNLFHLLKNQLGRRRRASGPAAASAASS